MEPRIVTKTVFAVVGLPFAGPISNLPFEAGQSNNEIGELWDRLNPRCGEIKHASGPAIGLCFGMPNDAEPWYIAGLEVSQLEDLPAGMVARTVPAQKYAVFSCTLHTLGATYRHIMEEWGPTSGYEHADAPDFELYDETFNGQDPDGGKMFVYWPIK